MTATACSNRNVLVIDDLPAVREDFRKILTPGDLASPGLAETEHALFGVPRLQREGFVLDTASQGEEGLAKVEAALKTGTPYALAFVDARMPPGWDGLETIERLWQADPSLQVVLCTAYIDHPLGEISRRLGHKERLLILKKPFDPVEVLQLAESLSEKWSLMQLAQLKTHELERRVGERTAALEASNARLAAEMQQRLAAESRLRQVQKLEALGTLSAGIAHEINNPLTVILANLNYLSWELERMLPTLDPELATELVAVTADSLVAATRVKKITRDMQRLGAPDSDQKAEVDVERALESTLTLLEGRLKRTTVVRDFAPVPPVRANESQLMHVFTHLITNALQALPGEGARRLTFAVRPSAAGSVEVSIQDNGAGISPQALEHVFDPFFTTRKVGEGLGLGLSVCHAIVGFMGGELLLESELGKGTRCRVVLPVEGVEDLRGAAA